LVGIDGRAITRSFLRVCLASAVLALVSFCVSRFCGDLLRVPITHFTTVAPRMASGAAPAVSAPISRVALQVMLSIGAGGAAYLLVLRLLRAPELGSFRDALRQRRAARGAAAEGAGVAQG